MSMDARKLAEGVEIKPFVLGTNVIGWTIDEDMSFRILDRFVDYGFDAIDTAESYSDWIPGHVGGESERAIGKWMKNRPGMRQKVKIIDKVGWIDTCDGSFLGHADKKYIISHCDAALQKLGTDYIDALLVHAPDPLTPVDESIEALEYLKQQGKILSYGCSNYDGKQLRNALTVSQKKGVPMYQIIEPCFNLVDREDYERNLRPTIEEAGMSVVTFYSLAGGFLTGLYKKPEDLTRENPRYRILSHYCTERNFKIISILDRAATDLGVNDQEVALAWHMQARSITAPISSAIEESHVDSFYKAATLELPQDVIEELDKASEY